MVVPTIPLLRAAFHLRSIVGGQGKTLETMVSSNRARGDEIVEGERVEGMESTTRTFDGLVDDFGGRVRRVGIIASGPSVLDVVLRLELLETLSAGVIDVLRVSSL